MTHPDADDSETYCVIGAGASGLTVVKNFVQHGIAVECFEREDNVGGNWYYGRPCSSVYRSTHLISSKLLTEYPDFPMPEDWPEYPSHEQALEYLQSYADHFGLQKSHPLQNSGGPHRTGGCRMPAPGRLRLLPAKPAFIAAW